MTGPDTPHVSIIIPCYNKQAYVGAAIESALAQTHPSEVIVIDDGSTDGSLAEIKRFEGQIIWETGHNRGGSAARNRGLDRATGRWVQFLDADDLLAKDKVATQVAALRGRSDTEIALCPWSLLQDDGQIAPPDPRHYWQTYSRGVDLLADMWYDGGLFPPHVWLVSRALIERIGPWDEALTGDDDGEFFGRVLCAAKDVHFCSDTQVFYRDPPEGSVSRDRSLKSAQSFWMAFEQVAAALLSVRNDAQTQKACLSRARKTGYAWRDVPEVLEKAAAWEKAHGRFDLSPSLPLKTRWLVAIFGLQRGLAIRRALAL